ncbi:dynactin 3, p24 subunit [Arctopsyche grandis]|uniref:dynactin 3, p24 subunit n=1 Tax=Arctopsyche grandis TaxID=121162 RepID=UPI00406D759C
MDPITVLESRLEQLEFKLGYPSDESPEKPVIEQLSAVDSVLNSVIAGKEKIAEVNKRIEDLNSYLDPQFVTQVNENKLKHNYVYTNEPEIRFHCKNMELCQAKMPVLDSDDMSNIPKLNKSLEEIKSANVENKEQSDQTEKCIQQMMETCHQVSLSIMENLVAISKKIDALEKVSPK